MPLTLGQAQQLITRLSDVLRARALEVEAARDAYEGRLPLKFAGPDFARFFAQRYEQFSDNWVGVVADSPTERLTPIGIQLSGEGTQEGDTDLWRVWRENDADADVGLAFLDAIIGRRAFAMVWGDDDDPDTPQITWESPSEAIVSYVPGSRRQRAAGLKLWRDEAFEFATLFTPDQVWRFQRAAVQYPAYQLYVPPSVLADRGQWTLREDGEPNPKPNPLGEVPLVELPNRPLLAREPISDVHGTLSMQHAINLLWSELFTTADAASFPQKVIMGTRKPSVPILNEQGQKIGERPIDVGKLTVDKLMWLESPEAKIGEWRPADLAIFTGVIEIAVGHIAAQTRTPQHYLVGKMANLSADALLAAETGLVKKCEEKLLYFGRAIREVFRLVALAQGNTAKAKAVASGTVRWRDVESRSEAQMADALLKLKQIGFPTQFLLERYGLGPTELARVVAMIAEEKAADADALLAAATAGLGGTDTQVDPGAGRDHMAPDALGKQDPAIPMLMKTLMGNANG